MEGRMDSRKARLMGVAAIMGVIILMVVFGLVHGISNVFYLILGAGLAAILALSVCVFLQHRGDGRRKLVQQELVCEGRELRIEYSFLRKVAGLPTKFRYKELETATDNFQSLLGRGGSGSVYKGILDDGTLVAVKRIEGVEHGEKEFRAEVAAISSVQHLNLVRLIGFCTLPGGPRFLIYEFVHNKSLDSWIFPQTNRRLPWDLRYRVAIDVGKALSYLHHDCRSKILHLDVKPENILLDENFRAVVADFGLSKLMRRDESRVYSTIRGTKGYLAPEWLLENGISEKSDVYGYGMVLLELVGGRRNVCLMGDGAASERRWSYFPKIVTEKLKQDKLMEVVDRRLMEGGGVDEEQVRVLVFVALWCIQEDPKLRPSMARVVDMLERRVVVDNPPDTEMTIVDLLSIDLEEGDYGNGIRLGTLPVQQLESQLPRVSTYSFISALSGR